MQYKTVDTVVNDEENLRLRIYDGAIPLSDAGKLLVELYKQQVNRICEENLILRARLEELGWRACTPCISMEDIMINRAWNVNACFSLAAGSVGDITINCSFQLPVGVAKTVVEASQVAQKEVLDQLGDQVAEIDVWEVSAVDSDDGESLHGE